MHDLLPLSWTRTACIRPVYRDIPLPLSRIRWITCADIPYAFSLQTLYDDLAQAYPAGFVFRGCTRSMAEYFFDRSCRILMTGSEAVLDLRKAAPVRKTVARSLARGKRHGYVEEVFINEENRYRFEQFRHETQHAAKPQLMHLFRQEPHSGCRLFVFRAFSGKWYAAVTLSPRGERAMHTELMLRHADAPGDIMECLIFAVHAALQNEGYIEWSLGEVPFMMPSQPSGESRNSLEQFMVATASFLRYAYDHEALYRFKNKFAPIWRPVMLCTSRTPSVLMLTELAVSMGYTDLLAYQSLRQLGRWFLPV